MTDDTMTLITVLTAGDCWLSADACALYLGMMTPDGRPNRRRFLETVAPRTSFPAPLQISGQQKAWKKSEVAQWAEDERRITTKAA